MEAKKLKLPVVGILGILKDAGERGLIDFADALDRLRATNFHISPALLHRMDQ